MADRRDDETGDVREPRPVEPEKKRGRGKRWGLLALLILFGGPLLVFGLWSWFALSYTYSRGDRAGFVQKFSEKGWICKTWEGELAMSTVPGSMPQLFQFTVRDDDVARQIQEIMRTRDGRVSLVYEEKKGLPSSCFGETNYFVTEARPVGPDPSATPAAPTAPAAPATAAPGTTPPTPAPTPAPAAPARP